MDTNRIVAGLDVHKDTIFLCIMGHDEAIIFQKTYSTLTPALHQMRDDMLSYGVSEAAMESTCTYWVPVWNVLEGTMSLKLTNPLFIKQLPGRKSDIKDAQWIAECLYKNLIKGSFVPDGVVQDMRKYNRRIFDLNDQMVYNTNKLDATLQRCGFRLSNYVCRTNGRSYQSCVSAIIEGKTDPSELVKLIHGRTVNKHGRDVILAAVSADFHKADIAIIRHYKEMIDIIERHIKEWPLLLTVAATAYAQLRITLPVSTGDHTALCLSGMEAEADSLHISSLSYMDVTHTVLHLPTVGNLRLYGGNDLYLAEAENLYAVEGVSDLLATAALGGGLYYYG